ncbi:MAG TPA: zinc ribbon domain-containing protein [Candidatus Sulfotelmatobacter sp.]|nr:zinc ribbon domain-containing protein [Candidatus Sulfotelmatobacter sp.]
MSAVLCSKCATDLPEGAQFCLKCGEPVKSASDGVLPAVLGCSKCGTTLPEGAEFCPKCGKPVSMPSKKTSDNPPSGVINSTPIDANPIEPRAEPPKPWLSRRAMALLAVGLLLIGVLWVAASDSPFAQGIQEVVGWKHDQTILDGPFSISAHNFRYYKFSLPEGSTHVFIVGHFESSVDSHNAGQKEQSDDSAIEVYVLSEPAFTVWQNGYATSYIYESGRVQKGNLDSEAPAGSGIYYLVFSNKFSPKTAKSINASVSLRYKNWVPESLQHAKDRFWNWVAG